jgi:hypothetical protein
LKKGSRTAPPTEFTSSINQEGKIFFNKHAVAALGTPDGVTLMYDNRRSTIGVKATPLNRQSAYRLRKKQKSSGGLIISAKKFLQALSHLSRHDPCLHRRYGQQRWNTLARSE